MIVPWSASFTSGGTGTGAGCDVVALELGRAATSSLAFITSISPHLDLPRRFPTTFIHSLMYSPLFPPFLAYRERNLPSDLGQNVYPFFLSHLSQPNGLLAIDLSLICCGRCRRAALQVRMRTSRSTLFCRPNPAGNVDDIVRGDVQTVGECCTGERDSDERGCSL